MGHDRDERPKPERPDEEEEIEILEVVGVDEDGFASEEDEEGGEDDVVIAFDETLHAEPEPAPRDTVARERLVRLQADFENLKKRIEREREDHYRHATGSLVSRLLPVLDNFERALVAARGGGSVEALLQGVEMVHRQFLEELRREGLGDIDAVGLPFDPAVHEAVATAHEDGLPPHTVVEEFQRGYFFHDRVLRPAMVRVTVDPAEGGEGREDA